MIRVEERAEDESRAEIHRAIPIYRVRPKQWRSGVGIDKRVAPTLNMVPRWGAAVLRPYMDSRRLGCLGNLLLCVWRADFRGVGEKTMGYQPIENYGIIGNMRTAALVGMNGSIDWYCSPHFDSPSVFGAILDDEKGGRFQIVPVAERVKSRQFYWPSTNILVTRFLHEDGITELEDFMPVGLPADSKWYHHLYRRIRCVRGTVKIRMVCRPAFDYGRVAHEVPLQPHGATCVAGKQSLHLCCGQTLRRGEDGSVVAEGLLEEGKWQVFTVGDEQA